MKNFNMVSARRMLRAGLQSIEAPAVDYIDWDTFEEELGRVMMLDKPSKPLVTNVFASACTRARQRYHRAVLAGAHFTGRPN